MNKYQFCENITDKFHRVYPHGTGGPICTRRQCQTLYEQKLIEYEELPDGVEEQGWSNGDMDEQDTYEEKMAEYKPASHSNGIPF